MPFIYDPVYCMKFRVVKFPDEILTELCALKNKKITFETRNGLWYGSVNDGEFKASGEIIEVVCMKLVEALLLEEDFYTAFLKDDEEMINFVASILREKDHEVNILKDKIKRLTDQLNELNELN